MKEDNEIVPCGTLGGCTRLGLRTLQRVLAACLRLSQAEQTMDTDSAIISRTHVCRQTLVFLGRLLPRRAEVVKSAL